MTSRVSMVFIVFLSLPAAGRCAQHNSDEGDVQVCLQFAAQLDPRVLLEAKAIAVDLFRHAGITLHWSCGLPDAARDDSEPIIVELAGDGPVGSRQEVLGLARPYAKRGTRIIVFYNRIAPRSSLLGYVLVHEIGHVLSGVAGHTRTGIMRAHWSKADLFLIATHRMMLSREDVDFMRLSAATASNDASGTR